MRGEAFRLQPLGLLAQVEKEFALRLRGADFDQPPVVDQETVDVGAHPPNRVRGKADAAVRVEVAHGLHQADVALLNQVEQVARGVGELAGDFDHQAQIGGNQSIRVGRIVMLRVALGDFDFFLAAEQRKAANFGQIAAQRIVGDQPPAFALGALLRFGDILDRTLPGPIAAGSVCESVGQFTYLAEVLDPLRGTRAVIIDDLGIDYFRVDRGCVRRLLIRRSGAATARRTRRGPDRIFSGMGLGFARD